MCATGYKGGAGGTGSISVGQILNGKHIQVRIQIIKK